MLFGNKPNSLAMGGVTFKFGRVILLAAVLLLMASCAQRFGPAPVVNGISGDKVNPVRGKPFITGRSVIVRKGDSLFKIARKYRVSLRGLIDVNHMKSPYTVYPGQKVLLPLKTVHVVRSGETIYQIAKIHNTDSRLLVRLNKIQPPYRLSAGQRLWLSRRIDSQSASKPAPARKFKREDANQTRIKSTRNSGTDSSLDSGTQTFKTSRIPPLKRGQISRREFIWPVSGRVLSRFGAVGKGLQNDGINILARKGTPVRAIQDGVVAYVGNELRGFGNLLLVKHFGGWISAYAHNDEILVNTGQSVRRGQVISRVGKTGSVDKPQLHFELRRGKQPVDPEKYLDRDTRLLKG